MKTTYTLEELNKMAEENDNLYLDDLASIPEGWCPTVRGSLWLNGLTSIPEGWNPTVGGCLGLNGLTSILNGWSPTVGGNLYLDGLNSIPEGFSPTVGCNLYLDGLTSIPNGWNPTVGGSLCLDGLNSIPESFKPTVGNGLWLNGLNSIPKGWNPVVGGSLSLDRLNSIPESFNPTVRGNLYLNGLTSIPDGCNPTIGGEIYYFKHTKCKISENCLQDGTYIPGEYLYADGILTHVKKCRKVGDYTYYIGKIKGRNVISDGKNYAHCDSFRDGVADLLFKSAADRGASQYEGLPLDTELTVDEAVTMYRIITGACKQGSKRFVDSLGKLKEKYTIAEMLKITEGQYNSERFAEFFGR